MASSSFSPNNYVKSYGELESGDFYIDVIGVPFRGPDYLGGKDLEGEYFDETTDIGPLEKVLSYFSHGNNPNIGKELIGTAERLSKEEEGWLYRIIVNQHNKYKNLIKRLAEANFLGASSTPHQNTAEKTASGLWKRWHVTEVGPTPIPANPLATQIIAKSLGEELEMANKRQKDAADAVDQGATPASQNTPVEEVTVESDEDDPPAEGLQEQIEKAFSEAQIETETADESAEETVTLSKSVVDQFLTFMQESKATSARLEKGLLEVQTALPMIAGLIAKSLRGQVAEDLKKSAPERTAEKTIEQSRRVNSRLPLNAPGNH